MQMPQYIITYDIASGEHDPHAALLASAEPRGLLYVWRGPQYVSRLPNTTLWGNFANREAAKKAFDQACKDASIASGGPVTVEKSILSRLGAPLVFSNERKPPEPQWQGPTKFETARKHQLNDPFFS